MYTLYSLDLIIEYQCGYGWNYSVYSLVRACIRLITSTMQNLLWDEKQPNGVGSYWATLAIFPISWRLFYGQRVMRWTLPFCKSTCTFLRFSLKYVLRKFDINWTHLSKLRGIFECAVLPNETGQAITVISGHLKFHFRRSNEYFFSLPLLKCPFWIHRAHSVCLKSC